MRDLLRYKKGLYETLVGEKFNGELSGEELALLEILQKDPELKDWYQTYFKPTVITIKDNVVDFKPKKQ